MKEINIDKSTRILSLSCTMSKIYEEICKTAIAPTHRKDVAFCKCIYTSGEGKKGGVGVRWGLKQSYNDSQLEIMPEAVSDGFGGKFHRPYMRFI